MRWAVSINRSSAALPAAAESAANAIVSGRRRAFCASAASSEVEVSSMRSASSTAMNKRNARETLNTKSRSDKSTWSRAGGSPDASCLHQRGPEHMR